MLMLMSNGVDVDWSVISVVDPEERGGAFAYTVGLAERGLCELHVWARPTHGQDPGLDFELSPRDMQHVLGRGAEGQVLGSFGPGSTFTIPFDGGTSEGHFSAGLPLPREQLDAFQAAPGAMVIPVRWELRRPPEGPLLDADPTTAARIRAQTHRFSSEAEPQIAIDTSAHQRFGPWTPAVTALSATLRRRPEHVVDEIEEHAGAIRHEMSATLPVIKAAARMAGRSEVVEHCCSRAQEDALMIAAEGVDMTDDGDGIDPYEYRRSVQRATTTALSISYAAVATWDLLDDATAARALTVVDAILTNID